MKSHHGFAARPRKSYLVVVTITLAPLVWSLADHARDTEVAAGSALTAPAQSGAPDHALLMAADVERALPVPQRTLPESLARATL
jgi:hypothetical protein